MFFFAMNAFFMWNFYSPKSFSSYSKFYSYFFLLLFKTNHLKIIYFSNTILQFICKHFYLKSILLYFYYILLFFYFYIFYLNYNYLFFFILNKKMPNPNFQLI